MEYLSQKKGFLGYDASQNLESKVIVVPFGLEKTVSYGGGTKNGPKEIIKASHQVELFDEDIERIREFDIITGEVLNDYNVFSLFPATQFVTNKAKIDEGILRIEAELESQIKLLENTLIRN